MEKNGCSFRKTSRDSSETSVNNFNPLAVNAKYTPGPLGQKIVFLRFSRFY